MSRPALLTLNAGSSSLKVRLFGLSGGLPALVGGKVTGIGTRPAFQVRQATTGQAIQRNETVDLPETMDVDGAISWVLDWLGTHLGGYEVAAAAHRIVHGGSDFDRSRELDPPALDRLRALVPLAPLHQPHNLKPVEILWRTHPRLRQFGCFDTAFHAGHGPLATAFALPRSLRDRGYRRYGFHGLSYAWIARSLQRFEPKLAAGRVVAAHLGSGASLCALDNGVSIDTTMGLTALDGLPMGTRCGAIDPGAVLAIARAEGLPPDRLERILYEESGLKGLSELSNDVRTLALSDDPRARFALDYFAYKTAQQIAAMATTMGGLDGIVFTGGIGENAEGVRRAILARLAWLPPFEVRVIPADEERSMAEDVAGLMDIFVGAA